MSKQKIEDNTKELLRSIKALQDSSIRWGARGQNNVNKLVWSEFGAGDNPERPVTRMTFNSQQTHKKLNKAAQVAISKVLEGEKPENALNIVGEVGLAEYRKTFRSDVPPPNAPSTIKKKGEGKNTLFDTSELFRSLGFDVVF